MEAFICQKLHFSNENPSRKGGEGERLLEGGLLKEGGVHNFYLILGGAFIGGRRLKKPIEILCFKE